ncbi:hypothetical protein BDZ45DRAFT_742582 [Acephala macrosclerotiorum]|nr:hypothetical protein BDZ45DRAFT_742582 [Acephala macrosclerotiorum]
MSLDTKDAIVASSDAEKGSRVDVPVAVEDGETFIVDEAVQRSPVRKLDFKLLLLLTLIYLFNSVRRSNLDNAKTEEKKAVAKAQMMQDSSKETDEKLKIKVVASKILDWRILAYSIVAFSYGTGSSIVGNFLPQLVVRLGYSSVKTNLYTVEPYCCGTDIVVAYFACFMSISGAATPSCIFHSWYNNNEAIEDGLAVITGFLVSVANSGGIFSSLSFKAKTAPKYISAM